MLLLAVESKFVPDIVTVLPTAPLVGENEVIVGTCPKTDVKLQSAIKAKLKKCFLKKLAVFDFNP